MHGRGVESSAVREEPSLEPIGFMAPRTRWRLSLARYRGSIRDRAGKARQNDGGRMRSSLLTAAVVAGGLIGSAWMPVSGQTLIVGNDQKPSFSPDGKVVMQAPGHDTLSILDTSQPAAPRIVATIPLDNTIV